jgi:hypothetical protein
MNTYYMNEKLGDTTITVENTRPSEYQDLVDDYLAKGGKITYCEEGEAEGALRLDRFDYAMESKMPNNSDAWSDYLNMEHLESFLVSDYDPINKIKRVTK